MYSCVTNSLTPVTPATGQNAAQTAILSTFSGNTPGSTLFKFDQYGISSVTEHEVSSGSSTGGSGTWSKTATGLVADENYQFRGFVDDLAFFGPAYGNTLSGRTAAMVAAADTPGSSAVTASMATISCGYTPNVLRSSCSAQLQYKKTTDVSWTNAGSAQTTGGYGATSISRDITGLDASTQYQVRLVITRTTINNTSLTSATASFTTLAGEPLVTTDAASGVAATSANLNGTLDINEGTSVEVYFEYGTDSGLAGASSTIPVSESADGSFQTAVGSLVATTTYYFRAVVTFSTPTGSPNYGDILSFTTPADPQADAAEEDHVMFMEMQGRYGVAKTIAFTLRQPASSSSDLLFTGTAPLQADVQIFTDGSLQGSSSDNAPAQVGSTQLYTLQLSAAEMTADEYVDVVIHDASATTFRDLHIRIWTKWERSEMLIDAATGSKANTTAFKAIGYGSGHGISAVQGATGLDIDGIIGQHYQRTGTAQAGGASSITLDASASATNDYYNGSVIEIIAGTGAGQARVITDYDGGTLVATVDTSWATNPSSDSVFLIRGGTRPWDLSPGVELSAIPTAASGFGKLVQFVFQRFAYKITQTATIQTLYKADSATSLGTRSASDNGVTQSLGKVS